MNNNYEWIPVPYMKLGIEQYIEQGLEPGGFLKALIQNDLREAVARADINNSAALADWVRALYSYAPSGCWGSPEAYEQWVAHKGLAGRSEVKA